MRLHDNLSSGHGYKVRLLLTQLGVPFERVEYDIDRGETRTARFLQEVNPNGRIPVLETEGGSFSRARRDPLLPCRGLAPPAGGRTGRASCSGCSSSGTDESHRTPELGFRALLTEGGAEQL
jgi:hypothetical protein